ncbi:hypothetical protein [Enterococcus sp. AZ136]|uniref:hypothetical protein n=1 Tax=Enterococcus sp. AZ136 TaxID=2774788 RepID=UPI003D2A6837
MKKLITVCGGILLFGLGLGVGTVTNAAPSVTTIETEKAKIEYFDIENGDFDVVVTPKKGYNVKPEWTLQDDKFYKDVYLVGSTKERASEHVDASNAAFPELNWELSWGNE